MDNPGATTASSAKLFGQLLAEDIRNDHDFYFFSPDETGSNKLDAVYTASPRLWQRPVRDWEANLAPHGQIIELLSENTLFSLLVGHNLSGGTGLLASYEAFLPIITSQLDQYLKFLDQARQVDWRPRYPALNLLSTSTCWRQDHNGFSHQNPGLISDLLAKPSSLANCLFPIDATAARAAHDFMLDAEECVNLVTMNKTDEPQWIDLDHARFQLGNGGASIFQFASDHHPHVIVAAAGDIVSREALYAIQLVKRETPAIQLRFVGLAALSYGAIGTTDNQFTQSQFDDYFTTDRPIVANFHGYPDALQQILANYTDAKRLDVHGYIEQGSTTTPFDMLVRNHASRFDLAISIWTRAAEQSIITPERLEQLTQVYRGKIAQNTDYIKQAGIDLEEITSWTWAN
jgi:xylulose-5-phosphate/fructose-6-phosphate phosphoketolase